MILSTPSLEASERAETGLADFVDGRPDLFKPDDYEKLYDLVHSGGGNAGFFSKTVNYYSPFSLYYSIYNFFLEFYFFSFSNFLCIPISLFQL